MTIIASSVEEYIEQVPIERQTSFATLISVCEKHLPEGFELKMAYHMPTFLVPHTLFPGGYHCNPAIGLPFLSIGNQKNFIGFYHSGLYMDAELTSWFKREYGQRVSGKLDMGKSCIRLKNIDAIPYELLAELCEKISVEQFITFYQQGRT